MCSLVDINGTFSGGIFKLVSYGEYSAVSFISVKKQFDHSAFPSFVSNEKLTSAIQRNITYNSS